MFLFVVIAGGLQLYRPSRELLFQFDPPPMNTAKKEYDEVGRGRKQLFICNEKPLLKLEVRAQFMIEILSPFVGGGEVADKIFCIPLSPSSSSHSFLHINLQFKISFATGIFEEVFFPLSASR